MKARQIVFSTLLGFAIVGHFSALPASAIVPTVAMWQKASQGFNLRAKVRSDIGKAFAKYYTELGLLDDREKNQPLQIQNGSSIIVRNYQARVRLAEKLRKKLTRFINQLNPGDPNAVSYLIDALNEAKEAETVFLDAEEANRTVKTTWSQCACGR